MLFRDSDSLRSSGTSANSVFILSILVSMFLFWDSKQLGLLGLPTTLCLCLVHLGLPHTFWDSDNTVFWDSTTRSSSCPSWSPCCAGTPTACGLLGLQQLGLHLVHLGLHVVLETLRQDLAFFILSITHSPCCSGTPTTRSSGTPTRGSSSCPSCAPMLCWDSRHLVFWDSSNSVFILSILVSMLL
jgi:hypothetical protein